MVSATTLDLTAIPNPVAPSTPVTFTTVVIGNSPGGTVRFVITDQAAVATEICAAAPVIETNPGIFQATCTATPTCTTSPLVSCDYSAVATYSGDAGNPAASSETLPFWVSDLSCRTSASPTLAMPGVTWLRSYAAGFATPVRVGVDGANNLLVADQGSGEIVVRAANGTVSRRVTQQESGIGRPVSIAAGGGFHYVGDGDSGRVSAYDANWQFSFDLGSGAGEFGHPGDIAYDISTAEVFVTDTDRHVVKVYNGANGAALRTLGGFGRSYQQFHTPTGLAIHGAELLVADQMNYRVQVLDKTNGDFLYCLGTYGTTLTGFGSDGGTSSRTLGMIQGLEVDSTGRLYVVDAFQGLIGLIDPSNGAPIGAIGGFGQGNAQLRVPTDLAIDAHNRLFVASSNNARLEVWGLATFTDPEAAAPAVITLLPASLDRNTLPSLTSIVLEVPGHAPAGIGSIQVNGLLPAASTVGDADLNGQPDLRLDLDPLALIATLGNASSGPVTVTGQVDGLTFSAQATLTITAAPAATATSLTASANPVVAGNPVTLSASVVGLSPTGVVTFRNGSTTLCAALALAAGQADCVATLPAGYHTLVAEYGGDTDDAGSVSPPYDLSVDPTAPAIDLASSDPNAAAGQTVTLSATINGFAPLGAVSFSNAGIPLCEGVELTPVGPNSALATCTAVLASAGGITANYLGDASNRPIVSAPLGGPVASVPIPMLRESSLALLILLLAGLAWRATRRMGKIR